MRSKNSEVARVLEKIEQRLRRRLGPNDDQYKRFKRKSEAIVKELSTRPRNSKRLKQALAGLLSEVLNHEGNAE